MALIPASAFPQSTLESVSTIFQANCTVGCHSGGSPSANLDLDAGGDMAMLRANLAGVTPLNPAAAGKGYKLVDPGYPHNSFILYKCAYPDWDDQFGMDLAEGNSMPDGQQSLAKEDVELIRQWIIYGALESGTVVDPQVLDDFYNDNGMARIAQPVAPPVGEGFQMHMGSVLSSTG